MCLTVCCVKPLPVGRQYAAVLEELQASDLSRNGNALTLPRCSWTSLNVSAAGCKPCILNQYRQQAHKIGAVLAICRSGWGELWTGSSRGSVRVWPVDENRPRAGGEGVRAARELRRASGGRPHSVVDFIIIPATGQVLSLILRSFIFLIDYCLFDGCFSI